MTYRSAIAVVLLCALQAVAPGAYASGTPGISFNAFGTLGVVHSDEDQADFVANFFAPEGVGYSDDTSASVDSRLGLQLSADITPRLSGIVQVIVEQRHDDTWEPTLEWANLAYDIAPGLSIRVGRMVLPIFLASEYRKVGYANPWVRPPQEVYRIVPVTSSDGFDISYRAYADGYTNTARVTYGNKDEADSVRARDGWTFSNMLERGPATLFGSYTRVRLTIDGPAALFDGFRQFGPEGAAIADRYDARSKDFDYLALGMGYDPGDWFVTGEWARATSRTFLGDNRGWYLTGGYRVGSFTPYATVARIRLESATSDPGLDLTGLPPPAAGAAAGLNAGLNALLGAQARQRSWSAGVRWSFHRNAALTLQYDHLDLDDGSRGVLINEQPGFRRGGSVSLFSAAIDFVF